MELDFELQSKGAFREIILEGNYIQIAIWLDGEWAVIESPLYQEKYKIEKPLFIIDEKNVLKVDEDNDFLDRLIEQIDEMLNKEIS